MSRMPIQLHAYRTSVGPSRLDQEIKPLKNEANKPRGGLWTSTYRDGGSAWTEWCNDEEFAECLAGVLLIPREDARVIHIDSFEDLRPIIKNYSFRHGVLWGVDFEKLMQHFDGMHVTNQGQVETRFSQPNLFGWDCESTVWFRWVFEPFQQLVKIDRHARSAYASRPNHSTTTEESAKHNI